MQAPKAEPEIHARQDPDQPFRIRVVMSDGGAHAMILMLNQREARDVAKMLTEAAALAEAYERRRG